MRRLIATLTLMMWAATAIAYPSLPDLSDDPPYVNTLYADFPGSTAVVSYSASTEILSSNIPFGTTEQPLITAFSGFPPEPVTGISGTVGTPTTAGEFFSGYWEMVASVDHSGTLHGGTYVWIGEAPALGIDTLQPLIAGTLLAPEGGSGLLGSVDYFNPVLAAITPTPDFLFISYAGDFCFASAASECSTPNLWESGFTDHPIESPDLYGFVHVPEPGTLPLLSIAAALGLLGLGSMRRRKAS